MTKLFSLVALCVLFGTAAAVHAQDPADSLLVRTFKLRSLTAADAAKLVAPYIRAPRGGVFDVGGARAITVREGATVLRLVDSLLILHDRPAEVVRLNFQLIIAGDSAGRDPAIAPVESALRGLFRFAGYRLLAQAAATVGEREAFSSTLVGDGRRYRVSGGVGRVTAGEDAAIQLNVSLEDAPPASLAVGDQLATAWVGVARLLSTGLTVPLNQTIVLGSGAPDRSGDVLILVVRAALVAQTGR